jgi:hypothetical protein
MSETEQLRAEVSQLREAVVTLAGFAEAANFALAHVPSGDDLASHPERAYSSLVGLLYILGRVPSNSYPTREFAPWIKQEIQAARDKRNGLPLRIKAEGVA